MTVLFLSFIAGVLTILSPCVLPVLPVIVGGSLAERSRMRSVIITGTLLVSVIVCTLLLKWSTVLLGVPSSVWAVVSGALIVLLGLTFVFPRLWERLSLALRLPDRSNALLVRSGSREGWIAPVLIGFSLGPVFTSCSPTYALIVATVLPQSFAVGLLHLFVYALGLALVLLLIAIFGQQLVARIKWAANPEGWFRRGLGLLFIAVGILIATGIMKDIEAQLVEEGFGVTQFEQQFVEQQFNSQ